MMEQYKHSQEEIIRLGETLISELQMELSVNTLARWIVHYLSELIVESGKPDADVAVKKEAFESILKLWEMREHLPVRQPMADAQQLLELLTIFKNKSLGMLSFFENYRQQSTSNVWYPFINTLKENSEQIFALAIGINTEDTKFQESLTLLRDNKQFLSESGKKMLDTIDDLRTIKDDGLTPVDQKGEKGNNSQKIILEAIDKLLSEQRQSFEELKKRLS